MQLAIFCHSLMSDWNHGNAHFLRGITTELLSRGHQVRVLEPHDAWSLKNLLAEHGETPLKRFRATYPQLKSIRYNLKTLDLDEALDGVDLVLVHEWNDHQLVARLGRHRHRNRTYRLLLHDTHHRALTDRESMVRFDLRHFDGVLAFGQVIRDLYLKEGWTKRAWTWHEAADTRIFRPFPRQKREGDLIWIGNWGDEERTAELFEFLLKPSRELKLKVKVHGVRYPEDALTRLARAGIEYGGWLPNY